MSHSIAFYAAGFGCIFFALAVCLYQQRWISLLRKRELSTVKMLCDVEKYYWDTCLSIVNQKRGLWLRLNITDVNRALLVDEIRLATDASNRFSKLFNEYAKRVDINHPMLGVLQQFAVHYINLKHTKEGELLKINNGKIDLNKE